MDDLIKALEIFRNYMREGEYNFVRPTHCEHDEMYVMVDPSIVSDADIERLDKLGFFANEDNFSSFRFGSA